jgi:uncharacterized membrane protein (GlpM family)
MPYLLKIVLSVLMVLAITEASKRFGLGGSLLASLPILSIISMIWIYADTHDTQKISLFSIQVFWFVIPSLGLFLSLPWFLARFSFPLSLSCACIVSIILYLVMLGLFRFFHYSPF